MKQLECSTSAISEIGRDMLQECDVTPARNDLLKITVPEYSMSILYMADTSADLNSGAAGTDYRTAESLRALGHKVEMVWRDDLPHRVKHGNLHYVLELPMAYEKTLRDRMKLKHYDVVVVSQPHGYLAAKTVVRRFPRTIFIHRSHGFEMRADEDLRPWVSVFRGDKRSYARRLISRVLSPALNFNNKRIVEYADGHIVMASQCRDFLCQRLGVPAKRIAVIPAAAPDVFLDRTAAAMTPGRLGRVLYVGQFAFFKAPMIVAAVMNELTRLNANLQFTWVCSKSHHNDIRELLSAEANRRISLHDWMTQDELLNVYDQHGIFLFPSFFEGFGKVFLEAMSRGLCVVASDNSGARDAIVNGENGILVPTGDAAAVVQVCEALLSSPHLAESMSSAARRTAVSYTWQRVGEQTSSFFKSILTAKATARPQ